MGKEVTSFHFSPPPLIASTECFELAERIAVTTDPLGSQGFVLNQNY